MFNEPDDTTPDRLANAILIWWTNQQDCELISAIFFQPTEGSLEDGGAPTWPPYIADQYASRYGRNGRGRLWRADGIGGGNIDPWPDTAFAQMLGERYAGIVINGDDLHHVEHLPGIVTDLRLQLLVARYQVTGA